MQRAAFLLGLYLIAAATPAAALALPPGWAVPSPVVGAGAQCRVAIRAAERASGIPDQLMAAIGRDESGRRDETGQIDPWPWSINVEGVDHVFATKAEAVAAVRAFQAQGVQSIDVGCMQVNLKYHPDAFASLDDGFDPVRNAGYAARFLVQLHERTGTWEAATAAYHSATPELGDAYRRKVMAVLPEEKGIAATSPSALAPMQVPRAMPPVAASAAGMGAFMLSNRAETARIIPLQAGMHGRDLAAYRTMAVPVVSFRLR